MRVTVKLELPPVRQTGSAWDLEFSSTRVDFASTMSNGDAYLWDSSRAGSLEAYNHKYEEWQKRNWMTWLSENLVFPFIVTRMEDRHLPPEGVEKVPFRYGHTMKVLGLKLEADLYGIIVKVREKHRVGAVPLCDLEVNPKTDRNYWPVREYVVWFANH